MSDEISSIPAQNELSRDERFIRDIDKQIESNLENEHFDVDQLADSMSFSRVQLYRKLQQLTSKNVSQYIREFRLKRAMELLEKDVANVYEIACRLGFSSPAYFNKCFHEYFGYPPGQVKKVRSGSIDFNPLIIDKRANEPGANISVSDKRYRLSAKKSSMPLN
jgi:transcriptional regulator GlxA family with amidase domain